jgi:hypothetical protein
VKPNHGPSGRRAGRRAGSSSCARAAAGAASTRITAISDRYVMALSSYPRQMPPGIDVIPSLDSLGGNMRFAACFTVVMLAIASVASAQTKPPTACSLLTSEDAAAALGEGVKGPKATNMPDGKSACEYTGSGIHTVHLNVMPFDAQTAGMYKAMCAKKTKEGLTELGDTACWYNDKHGELQVLKGLTFYSIQLRKSGDPTEAIKGVAKKVYDRLK